LKIGVAFVEKGEAKCIETSKTFPVSDSFITLLKGMLLWKMYSWSLSILFFV
jgi:hypothetical protein